jgi:sterol desaturase/sphingolipid hydroxylase (fatty acid hydroxylase superfamily)
LRSCGAFIERITPISRLDVTTASRFHVGQIVLSSILRIPVIALLGVQMWELALYEMAMFSVVQLHHANVALPASVDRRLRCLS